jgi:hypothetical protein
MPTHKWQGRWNGRSPAGDIHLRARNVITPSGGIVRGKFPSRKNGRMVHHEGLLELDAIYLFETSPEIVRYREQPASVHYADGPKLRRYTPDFELLLATGESVTIEVKPTRFLEKKEIRHKFDCIEAYMRGVGTSFVILTDKIIRLEPRLSNLRQAYHEAARVPPTSSAMQIAVSRYADRFPASIKATHEFLSERHIEPFSLLLAGLLRCALDAPITFDTSINISTEADNGWFWIAEEHGF